MESMQTIDPMIWIIIFATVAISAAVLLSKVIKVALKLAVIAVMLLMVVYFLIQAGVIPPPSLGK